MANCITRHIPNTSDLPEPILRVYCLCHGIRSQTMNWALAFIIFSAVFDFFDGMMARATGRTLSLSARIWILWQMMSVSE